MQMILMLPKPSLLWQTGGFYFDRETLAWQFLLNRTDLQTSKFSFPCKKKPFKCVCVGGEHQWCELGVEFWSAGGSWLLLGGSAVYFGFKAVPGSALLGLPANHSQSLAPEAWRDECFACWNKISSEIWPDPVKSHEIT